MKYTNTRDLLNKMLRWLWLALLVGALLAGGFYVLRSRASAQPSDSEHQPASEDMAEEESSPYLRRFALYVPDFSSYTDLEGANIGLNEYALSYSNYVAARFRTDEAFLLFYRDTFAALPALDDQVFTLDDLRAMIGSWPYNNDVVLCVSAPDLSAEKLDQCAKALGIDPDAPDAHAQVQCLLRDQVFAVASAYLDDPSVLGESGVPLRRVDASLEKLMAEQSAVSAEAEQGIIQISEREHTKPGKKMLVLVFLAGFAAVEALVLLLALFDPRVKSAADLEQNTTLRVLQTVSGDAPLTEAALRYAAASAPALLGVGIDGDALQDLSERLDAAFAKKQKAPEGKTAPVAAAADSIEWLTQLDGRPVVLAVRAHHTDYRTLKAAADQLEITRSDVYGAILLKS